MKALLVLAAVALILALPAASETGELCVTDPDDHSEFCVQAGFEHSLATAEAFAAANATRSKKPRVLVAGDSWAALVGAGSKYGLSFFARKLREHSCHIDEVSIAIPGTTSTDWIEGGEAYQALVTALKAQPEYLWMQILGNDALMDMPDCASNRSKTAQDCGDELFAKSVKNMEQFADMVHAASPATKIVGFGYDTMFGGLGCSVITRMLFPQCYRLVHGEGGNACFNEQFLRIQGVWDQIAQTRPWLTNTTILGATQVAAGDAKASTGADRHIDMEKMGPAKYWPDYEACFHPGVFGGDKSGAMVVMEEFYREFWSSELGC